MTFLLGLFDDKRLLIVALLFWTVISSFVFCVIMIKDRSPFLSFGPNEQNKLLGVKLDNWTKWWVTAVYTFVSTAIAAFSGDSIVPFITNTIMDHKTTYIPYSKFTCLMIIQVFTVYGVIMSVIGMFVALTQVDFMLIRILADILINYYTTARFLRGKEVNSVKYEQWKGTNQLDQLNYENKNQEIVMNTLNSKHNEEKNLLQPCVVQVIEKSASDEM